ncbi:ester cyclase [Rhodococcus opacus]|uniref:ester cyclase n=1 Tax=Rhodococcus opacus TaxID=37919 RepID=UPI001FF24E7E|nr:ester cyclase [Rhodococcus opacus]UOT01165.1 ester cyclase [Rhodococcus opacus]
MNSLTQIVTDLYTAYNNHRPADVAKLYAPLCRHRDIAAGADHRTPEKIAAGLAGFFAAFPDAQWSLDDTLIDGNRAAVTYALSGHLNGRLGPYEPKGQSVHLAGVQMLEVKGNRIITSTDYWDGGALHRQLSRS